MLRLDHHVVSRPDDLTLRQTDRVLLYDLLDVRLREGGGGREEAAEGGRRPLDSGGASAEGEHGGRGAEGVGVVLRASQLLRQEDEVGRRRGRLTVRVARRTAESRGSASAVTLEIGKSSGGLYKQQGAMRAVREGTYNFLSKRRKAIATTFSETLASSSRPLSTPLLTQWEQAGKQRKVVDGFSLSSNRHRRENEEEKGMGPRCQGSSEVRKKRSLASVVGVGWRRVESCGRGEERRTKNRGEGGKNGGLRREYIQQRTTTIYSHLNQENMGFLKTSPASARWIESRMRA